MTAHLLQTLLDNILNEPKPPYAHPVSEIAINFLKQHNVYDDNWQCTYTNGTLVWFNIHNLRFDDLHDDIVFVCTIEVRNKVVKGCEIYVKEKTTPIKIEVDNAFDLNLVYGLQKCKSMLDRLRN